MGPKYQDQSDMFETLLAEASCQDNGDLRDVFHTNLLSSEDKVSMN